MTVIGTVTRSGVNTIAAPETGATNVGSFVARTAAGLHLGFFPTAEAAKSSINAATGTALRWSQENLRTGVEHYVGRDANLSPLDIWGSDLLIWAEADAGARVVDPTLQSVDLLGDRSGNGTNWLQSDTTVQGTLVQSGINGLPSLQLTQASLQRMTAALDLPPPFTVFIVANYTGIARTVSNLIGNDETDPWMISVDGTGAWEYLNSRGATITGGVATATAQLLTVRQDTSWGEFRIDRASVGGNGNNPDEGDTVLLSDSVKPFGGLCSAIIITQATDLVRASQTEDALQRKYNTP